MFYGWEFIIYYERDILIGPQGPTGTILVPVAIELVPVIGLLPFPRLSCRFHWQFFFS